VPDSSATWSSCRSRAASRDAVGQRTTTWTNVAQVYAKIEQLSGSEQFIAAQRQASSTHKVSIRYDSRLAEMDGSYRFMFGTRPLILDAPPVNQDERNILLECTCVEGLRDE
jgi:SPP1 family predicted phage head-tail adaptor